MSFLNSFAALVAVALLVLLVMLWRQRRGLDRKIYSPTLAWLRGGIYFCACLLLSWATGVLESLVTTPLVTAVNRQDPVWLGFTIVCFAVIVVGYFVVWPRGTLTHGRLLSWPAVLIFGLLWGLSEGQLFAAIWSLAARFLNSPVWIVLAAFIVIATFNGLWHALYWDIYVAPEHNIEAWNSRKVLLAHIPNLSVTLIYLTRYESFAIFVLLQTLALVASTYFMRFPPFWKPYLSHPPTPRS